ncbi:MAG: RagB/SusD family nutrient uptake outer membrane protein [Chitinophagaceae bacterium]
MIIYNKALKIAPVFLLIAASSCTKLDQNLNSTLTSNQAATALGANGTQLLLQNAYNDLPSPYHNVNSTFTLEEVTADQCVVPTRAGDWDDGGEWRALKKHTFTGNGTSHISGQFNALNKLNFDATNVLAFNPTKQQAAEARFLRAISLYQLLDLFGQFPFRNPGDNLLNAPKVLSGEEAVQFIISELNAAVTDLPATSTPDKASKDAANFLLMRAYLNHGAFINRAAPTFSDADMQKVISLGNALIASGKYSYTANYFENFIINNSGSKEAIFNIPSTKENYSDFHNRWYATLHYNQYTPKNPQAGWNGFSTVADFYNSFGITTTPTQTLADSVLDGRIGERFFKGATDISGVRPGLLIGSTI